MIRNDMELTGMHELFLVETDSKAYKSYEQLEAMKRKTCEDLITILRFLVTKDGEFNKIINYGGQTRIVYAKYGMVFLPKCTSVTLAKSHF
jgi:hypothetical protein